MMLKIHAKKRLGKQAYAEKKRINADKDAALQERLQKIQKLEAQLEETNAKVVHLDKTTALLGQLEASGTIKLENDGSVSVLSTPARKQESNQHL